MTAGSGDEAAGGPARHASVMLPDVLTALNPQAGGFYVDGTFGGGGYSRAILEVPGTSVLAIDRDPAAIATGSRSMAKPLVPGTSRIAREYPPPPNVPST